MVMQVEAAVMVDHDGDDQTEKIAVWMPILIASSTSSSENTENLWLQLKNQRRFLIQVKSGEGQAPFLWDYALAWRVGKSSVQK